MDLVAHVQRLRDERFDIHGASLREGCIEHAVQRGSDPPQAVDNVGTVGAEAQHLAEPLIQIAESAVASRRIANDPHRHRRTDDAGHWANRAVMMAGRESNGALLGEPRGGFVVLCPALEQECADDGPLHGPTHARPLDRGPGVKDTLFVHARNDLTSQPDSHDFGLSGEIGGEGLSVRRLDFGVVDEARQRPPDRAVAAGWRCPFDMSRLAPGLHDLVGERGQTNVEHLQLLFEKAHVRSPPS